jgi:hypothetical protein
MAARKLLIAFALAALSLGTGCQSWCNKHYPCQCPCPAYPSTYAPAAGTPCPPPYTPPPVPPPGYAPCPVPCTR